MHVNVEMMAEGGVAPPPPKRPSIRPPPPRPSSSVNAGAAARVPGRPAPPVPGGKPPPPRVTADGTQPVRYEAQQSLLRKENGQTKPPVRPASTTEKSAVRKRPEITIVCARPMSEVGFRDTSGETHVETKPPVLNTSQSKPSSQNARQPQSDTPVKPSHTPTDSSSRSIPTVPPREDLDSQRKVPVRPTSKPPPIPKTSPNVPLPNKSPTVVPRHAAPSPSPRPAPRTQNLPADKVKCPSYPPPVPQRTAVQQLKHQPSPTSLPQSPAPPLCVPEPVPRPRAQSGEANTIKETSSAQPKDTDNAQFKSEDQSLQTQPLPSVVAVEVTLQETAKYPQPLKSSRPTIIRVKKSDSGTTKVESVDSKPATQKSVPPDLPNIVDSNVSNVSNSGTKEIQSNLKTFPNSDVNEEKTMQNNPSEVEQENSVQSPSKSGSILKSVKMFESQMNKKEQNFSVAESPKPVVKPPIIAPKPKPAVLPKPGKTIVSPSSVEKPLSEGAITSTKKSPVSSLPDDDEHQETSKTSNLIQSDKNQKVNESKPAVESNVDANVVKPRNRPTIIRGPPKPKRQISENSDSSETPIAVNNSEVPDLEPNKTAIEVKHSETPDSESMKSTTQVVRRRQRSSDDSQMRLPGRPPPPLPSKRPASIASIPQGFSLTDINLEEQSNMEGSHIPKPKPAERTRPVTLHVSSDAHDNEQMVRSGRQLPSVVGRPLPSIPSSPDARGKQARPDGPPQRPSPVVRKSSSSSDDVKTKPSIVPTKRFPPVSDKSSPPDPQNSSEGNDVEKHPTRPRAGPVRPASVPLKSRTEDRELKEVEKPPRPTAAVKKPDVPRPPSPARPSSITSPKLPQRPGPGHPLYHYMMNVPHGIALHDFESEHQGDLSFKAEDVVVLVKRVDDSWLHGKVGENEGLFPQEFVQIVRPLTGEPLPSTPTPNVTSARSYSDVWDAESNEYTEANDANFSASNKPDLIGHGPRCQARFDYEGGSDGDLVFEEGDYIRLLERVGDEWMKGEFNGNIGIFPLAFVEIIEDLPEECSESTIASPESGYKSAFDSPDKPSPLGGASGNMDDQTYTTPQAEGNDLPSVMVLYNFESDAPGDLPVKFGDYVKVLGQVNEEWLYGQCNGKEGQFPIQFIDQVPENLPQYTPGSRIQRDSQEARAPDGVFNKPETISSEEAPYCIALYDFMGQSADELSFKQGEVIQLLRHIGEDWLKGRLKGTDGIFPVNFVRIEKECEVSSQTMKNYAEACFDFEGQDTNELSFKKGDHILVGEKVVGAPDWQWGELNGCKGIFPASFVTVIES